MIPLRVSSDGEDAPEVYLLDARVCGLEPAGLRERARRLSAESGAPFVSRSYRYPFALIGWHDRELGIDLERIGPCDKAFADLICTPTERADRAVIDDPDRSLTSLWCAKEALAKVLGDALLYEPARLESPVVWPHQRAGIWRAARLIVPDSHVAWLCWRSATSPRSTTATTSSSPSQPGRQVPVLRDESVLDLARS